MRTYLIPLLAVTVVLDLVCLTGVARASCEEATVASALSPERDVEAIVRQEICSDGFFTTAVTDVVYLVNRGASPSDQDIVLVVDEGGRFENRPILHWIGKKQLQLILAAGSHTSQRKTSLRSVDVVIKFESLTD